MMDIRIEIAGELPPAKGEALSMLSRGHAHEHRVRRLLEEASTVMAGNEVLVGPVALDVTVTAPDGHRLPDATNMLGGIGDVLQTRSTGADVEHLGALGRVGCFEDDAQVHEIHYRRLRRVEVGYVVVIRPIPE